MLIYRFVKKYDKDNSRLCNTTRAHCLVQVLTYPAILQEQGLQKKLKDRN